MLVTDGLDGGFKDSLVSWEFWAQASPGLPENSTQKRKYSVRGRPVLIETLIAAENMSRLLSRLRAYRSLQQVSADIVGREEKTYITNRPTGLQRI